MQCEMYTIKILFGSQQVTNVKMFKKKNSVPTILN